MEKVSFSYHPSKVDVYAVTREQLELVSQGHASDWTGYFQNALSVMLTCAINILALGWHPETASFSLNAGLGMLSLSAGAVSLYMAYREGHKRERRLAEILMQPVQGMKATEEQLF